MCSIPALLAMKGHALAGRYKQKDAYDIYYCVRNYPWRHRGAGTGMSPTAGDIPAASVVSGTSPTNSTPSRVMVPPACEALR